MKANINNTPLKVATIPKRYTRPNGQTVERYDLRDDLWHDDGWRDVVVPTYNQDTQELGQLIYDQQNEVVTYAVVDLPPLTPEEIQQKAIDDIKQAYEAHKSNGWELYQTFRAGIVIDINAGTITIEQAFVIEQYLKVAFDRIANTGDWKTSQYELSQVTGFPAFVQPYYDKAMTDIATYINENYS